MSTTMEEILTKERRWDVPKQTLNVEIFKRLLAARQLARHKALQEQAIRNANATLVARKASEDEDDYGSDDASGMEADQQVDAADVALENGAVPMEVDVFEGPVISFGYESASEREGALERAGPSSQKETTESVGPVELSAEELARSTEAARQAAEATAAAEREAAEAAATAEREAAEAAAAAEREAAAAEAEERARLEEERQMQQRERQRLLEERRLRKEERRRQRELQEEKRRLKEEERRKAREQLQRKKDERRRLLEQRIAVKVKKREDELNRLLAEAKQARDAELERARAKKAAADKELAKAADSVAKARQKLQELRATKDALVLQLKQITRACEAEKAREAAVLANLEEGERLPSPDPPNSVHVPQPTPPAAVQPPPFNPSHMSSPWRPSPIATSHGPGGSAGWTPQTSPSVPPASVYTTPGNSPLPGSLPLLGPSGLWMSGGGTGQSMSSHSGSSGGGGGLGTGGQATPPSRNPSFTPQPFGPLSSRPNSLPPPPPPLPLPGPTPSRPLTHNLPPHLRGNLRGPGWGMATPPAASGTPALPPHLAGAPLSQGRPGIPPTLIPTSGLPQNRIFGVPLPPPPPPRPPGRRYDR